MSNKKHLHSPPTTPSPSERAVERQSWLSRLVDECRQMIAKRSKKNVDPTFQFFSDEFRLFNKKDDNKV